MPSHPNPFRIAGELAPDEMIDRDDVANRLFALASGGHSARLVAPRRYGKTSLLRRVLAHASSEGWATALVDLEGVLSLSSLVVRIERDPKGIGRPTVFESYRAAPGAPVMVKLEQDLDGDGKIDQTRELDAGGATLPEQAAPL